MKKSILLVLTKGYPFAREDNFIANEIQYLAKAFDQVLILSTHGGKTINFCLPENVEAYAIMQGNQQVNKVRLLAKSIITLLKKEYIVDDEAKTFMQKWFNSYYCSNANFYFRIVESIIDRYDINVDETSVSIYSFWFADTALLAALLKEKISNAWAVSRAHRYDLYKYCNRYDYLPLRAYLLGKLDHVYPCSKDGCEYLQNEYPSYKTKITTNYLGVPDCGVGPSANDIKAIVSCSNVIPVKRVQIIAEAFDILAKQHPELTWTHFGGGPGLKKLKKWQKHCGFSTRVMLAGFTDNRTLRQYYADNTYTVFVNVSVSEGLPVSIMEAISAGVPVIATDVGGTVEIINHESAGILLSGDVTPELLAENIKKVINMPYNDQLVSRKKAREYWETHFWDKENYTEFAKKLHMREP